MVIAMQSPDCTFSTSDLMKGGYLGTSQLRFMSARYADYDVSAAVASIARLLCTKSDFSQVGQLKYLALGKYLTWFTLWFIKHRVKINKPKIVRSQRKTKSGLQFIRKCDIMHLTGSHKSRSFSEKDYGERSMIDANQLSTSGGLIYFRLYFTIYVSVLQPFFHNFFIKHTKPAECNVLLVSFYAKYLPDRIYVANFLREALQQCGHRLGLGCLKAVGINIKGCGGSGMA